MAESNKQLLLHEAIALRHEYDERIKFWQGFAGEDAERNRFLSVEREEKKEPAKGFKLSDTEDELKKVQSKRVKINQEIQKANYNTQIEFLGEIISLAEALEIRKNLKKDAELLQAQAHKAAYKIIIHKEERDIAHEPKHDYAETRDKYLALLKNLRHLEGQLHEANHKTLVGYRDEE